MWSHLSNCCHTYIIHFCHLMSSWSILLFLVKHLGLPTLLEGEVCFITSCGHLLCETSLVVKGNTSSFCPKLLIFFSHGTWGGSPLRGIRESSRLPPHQTEVVLREDRVKNYFCFSDCCKSNIMILKTILNIKVEITYYWLWFSLFPSYHCPRTGARTHTQLQRDRLDKWAWLWELRSTSSFNWQATSQDWIQDSLLQPNNANNKCNLCSA